MEAPRVSAPQEISSARGAQDAELEEMVVDPGCCDTTGCMDDPFPTISDKTIQRTADIYLPIPGAALSLVASVVLATKRPLLASDLFTLFGAATTMAGKVVSSISDRRMLKQPMQAAREVRVDEGELFPKGCVESAAHYANLVNLGATMVSVVGIILGGVFLFGAITKNDTNNDIPSSGNDPVLLVIKKYWEYC